MASRMTPPPEDTVRGVQALGFRSRARAEVPEPREHESSTEVFAEMLRSSTPGSPEERIARDGLAARKLVASAEHAGLLDPALARLLVKGIGALAFALSVVAPIINQSAGIVAAWFGPDSETKDALETNTAALLALSKSQTILIQFVVSAEEARRIGGPPPEVPAALRLVVIQREADAADSIGP